MNQALSDIAIFRIQERTWLKIQNFGQRTGIPRVNHLSFMKGNKMFVLGGVNNNGFCHLKYIDYIDLSQQISLEISEEK